MSIDNIPKHDVTGDATTAGTASAAAWSHIALDNQGSGKGSGVLAQPTDVAVGEKSPAGNNRANSDSYLLPCFPHYPEDPNGGSRAQHIDGEELDMHPPKTNPGQDKDESRLKDTFPKTIFDPDGANQFRITGDQKLVQQAMDGQELDMCPPKTNSGNAIGTNRD
jgi:hypothetical protein